MDGTSSRPDQLDSPTVATIIKYGSKAQAWLYQRTRGKIGSTWRIGAGFRKPVPTLLLDHYGRKSGTRFTIPLLYLDDGSDIVIVASQGGLPNHPQWYFNFLDRPETTVQIKSEIRRVHARVAGHEERAALWPRLTELYADFDKYQEWTDREIPVLVLEAR